MHAKGAPEPRLRRELATLGTHTLLSVIVPLEVVLEAPHASQEEPGVGMELAAVPQS